MKSKKILFAVSNDLSHDQRMHRICRTLTRHGYDVKLIGRLKKSSDPLNILGFEIHRLKCLFQTGLLFYAEYNIRLFLYLLWSESDAISAVDLDTILGCRLASLLRNKPFFFDSHELFTEVPELQHRSITKKIWSMIGQLCLRPTTKCYTVNDSLAALLSSKYKAEFTSVYNYPEVTEETTEESIDREVKILYQGMINKGRGLLEVIEAIKNQHDYRLDIIGIGDVYAEVDEAAKNATATINMLGFMPPEKLSRITANYHVGLNLLDASSGNYYQSSANKFFDYIMAGLPVISMDFPEYRKVVDEYEVGVLLPDLKPSTISAAIQQVTSAYAMYRNNCLQARQSLHWISQEEKLLTIYSSVLDS